MPEGEYHGRLTTDGSGHLLADEGEYKGWPVAFDEGVYIYVQPGEPSHNERHHQNYAEFQGTVDQSMVAEGDEDLVNADEETNAHHFDLPDPDAPAPVNPDAVGATVTSHTDATPEGT